MGVWIGVAIGVGLVALAGYAIMRLRSLQATVDDSWQQVLLALRRRRDLVAELAEAVLAGSGGEVDLVARVDEAMAVADLPGALPEQQVMAERDLEAVLAELSEAIARSLADGLRARSASPAPAPARSSSERRRSAGCRPVVRATAERSAVRPGASRPR